MEDYRITVSRDDPGRKPHYSVELHSHPGADGIYDFVIGPTGIRTTCEQQAIREALRLIEKRGGAGQIEILASAAA